jgi:SulP family sulfate permease
MQAGREGSLLSPSFLAQVDWLRVAGLLPTFGSVALIHAIGMLLNATGLELATGREVDINAELRCTGLANLVVGGVGGPVGFLGLGVTLLGERMGARSRIVGYVTGIVCLAGLLIAGTLIQVLPIFLMGGLLMYLGIELIYDWGWKIRHHLPWHEWSVVVAILAVIATVGFMEGMG